MKKPRMNNKKKQNSKNRASRNRDWKIETWMDERTGVHFVEIGFPRIDGSQGIVQVSLDQIDTPAAVRKMLRKQGASLDRDSRDADNFVEKILAKIPDKVNVVAAVPGWRKNLFLLPGRVIGKSDRHYRLRQSGDGPPVIGVTSGTHYNWKKNVAEPAMDSSYIAFGIMAGLAAPLLRFASLTEGVIFNFAGESSTGKTTAAKVAATVAGAPSPLPSWNITDRRLDERAAEYNDILLVLDDTEKRSGRTKNTAQALNDAAHVMTGGQSKDYSDVVSGPDRLERLHWRCTAISTSPFTAESYALKQGETRSDGARARFIDVPVPDREDGGVIDRLSEAPSTDAEAGKGLIKALEGAILRYHGAPLVPWTTYLLADVDSETVDRLIQKFVTRSTPDGDGFDDRVAKKFGLVYAAGRLAVRAGILPWPKVFPFEVAMHCYQRARSAMVDLRVVESEGVTTLLKTAKDRKRFPALKRGERLPADLADTWVGIRRKIKGRKVLAVRGDQLDQIAGNAYVANQLVSYLKREGMLLPGHGGKATLQIPIGIQGNRRKPERMRFYAVDHDRLRARNA